MIVYLPRAWALTLDALAALWTLAPGDAIIRLLMAHPDVRAVEVARFTGKQRATLAPPGGETHAEARPYHSHPRPTPRTPPDAA